MENKNSQSQKQNNKTRVKTILKAKEGAVSKNVQLTTLGNKRRREEQHANVNKSDVRPTKSRKDSHPRPKVYKAPRDHHSRKWWQVINAYTRCVIDPFGYPPVCPPIGRTQQTSVVVLRQTLSLSPVPFSSGGGTGAYFMFGAATNGSAMYPTLPPYQGACANLGGATGVIVGSCSNGMSAIDPASLFSTTGGLPATYFGVANYDSLKDIISDSMVISASFYVQNENPNLSKQGRMVLFSREGSDTNDLANITTENIDTYFANSRIGEMSDCNGQGSLLPTREKSYRFTEFTESGPITANGATNGICGVFVTWPEGADPQNVLLTIQVSLQYTPEAAYIDFLNTSSTPANSLAMDSSFNIFCKNQNLFLSRSKGPQGATPKSNSVGKFTSTKFKSLTLEPAVGSKGLTKVTEKIVERNGCFRPLAVPDALTGFGDTVNDIVKTGQHVIKMTEPIIELASMLGLL